MDKAIYLKTKLFDPSCEEENPINPIYGSTLINWLAKKLDSKYEISEASPEDWGWYSYINYNGRYYLIGSVAYYESGDDPEEEIEWVFQVDKKRTFKEKLFGREKMNENDPCFRFFVDLFKSEPGISSVEIG